MATLTRGQTFGSTETVTNTKLHNLVDLGGVSNIVDADCSPSMSLSDSKLADITTGNKVRGSALGNLASIPSSAGLIPIANIPVTLASIPNSSLLPLTLASWVDAASFRNLQSAPSLAGQLPWFSVMGSGASGAYATFDGQNKIVSSQPPTYSNVAGSYAAGSYIISGPFVIITAAGFTSSYIKTFEMVVPRGGTLRIKWGALQPSGGNGKATIYRNGSAVGTERTPPTPSSDFTEYSEDISGWTAGDLLQIYTKGDGTGGPLLVGGVRLFENSPVKETVNSTTYSFPLCWSGTGAPGNSMGTQGDLYIRLDGGASTTLYVKTGASTWTAK